MIEQIPSLDIDFYGDDVIKDPYPVYKTLRDTGPVVYLPGNDLYALPRYDEVSYVLREPLRFPSSKGVSPIQKVNDILAGSTLNSDPPEHDRTRSVTSAPLLPGALSVVEPRIHAASENLIATLCEKGSFDAVSDLAQHLPLSIVAELVGLPDAGRANMLKWASATFNLFGTENERASEAFKDLTELRDFLLEYGQPDKLKPGGWAKRIFEIGPERGIPPEKCAQLMRDYIAPSLDTTISTTAQLIKFFIDSPDQWDLLRNKPELVGNAIEEAVRLSTPIRAFTRYVSQDSRFGRYTVSKGKRVIVIYASANRDERKYGDPERFDITRDVHDHLGFGQGVHMCMGMHLARLEISSLLNALIPRVKHFTLTGNPTVAMNNTIRAYSSLPIQLKLDKSYVAVSGVNQQGDASTTGTPDWLPVVITERKQTATDTVSLELRPAVGSELPAYSAGAHVDVRVRDGLIRQYSLTGNPQLPGLYRLGILLDSHSRGGSSAIHAELDTGSVISVGTPRNHFPLVEQAGHSLLMAGGIGITPILAMAHTLKQKRQSFELHYCARSTDRFAFREELEQFGDYIHLHTDDGPQEQKLDLTNVLDNPSSSAHIYICGPNGFMDHVENSALKAGWLPECIHIERFGAELDTDGEEFQVFAKRSAISFTVQPGETIAAKLAEHDIIVPMSCQSGVCGTCLTRVIEGKPDHRDLVQTDVEKAANDQITVCCSRSKTRSLVLDV